MSLIKKPELTPEKLAANQANAQLSRGPVTPEGLQRAREARVIHGFYAGGDTEALCVLGENPKEFSDFCCSLLETWQAHDLFERRLVERLARALWRFRRGDRMQESMAVTRMKRMDADADRRARQHNAFCQRKLAGLNLLLKVCDRVEFVTTQAEIDTLASAYRGGPKGRASEVLVLLLRLAPVHAPRPELPAGDGLALQPGPDPPVAEGLKREEIRGQLQALLHEEIEALEEWEARQGEELLETTSPYYRDTLLALEDRRAALMARMEAACARSSG